MVASWRLVFTKQAQKDAKKISAAKLRKKTEKLLEIHQTLGNSRYLAQIGLGGLPFAETARSIELLATEIMPAVNREVSAALVSSRTGKQPV